MTSTGLVISFPIVDYNTHVNLQKIDALIHVLIHPTPQAWYFPACPGIGKGGSLNDIYPFIDPIR